MRMVSLLLTAVLQVGGALAEEVEARRSRWRIGGRVAERANSLAHALQSVRIGLDVQS